MENKCSDNAEQFYSLPEEDLEILGLNCKIRTRKRNSYYRFPYNPLPIYNNLKNLFGKEYIDDSFYMFDFKPKVNCCYCISLTLYFTLSDKEYFEEPTSKKDIIKDIYKYEYRYLLSILQTINDAKLFLPDWLVRIYLDQSVYKVLRSHNNKNLCSIFNLIFNSENVEIYTYSCNVKNIEKTRSYRFLPMIDPSVAKVAIREADGYVGKLDCNNINVFSKSDKIFYLAEYFHSTSAKISKGQDDYLHEPAYDIVNDWIYIYKNTFRTNYFSQFTNLYSLVAGTITLNLQVKQDYYFDSFKNISQMIKELQDDEELSYIMADRDFDLLDVGFDEIFLLELFREAISISKELDYKEYFLVSDLFYGSINITNLKIEGNTISKCVKNLYPLVNKGYLEYIPEIHPNENIIDFLKIVDSSVSLSSNKVFNILFPELHLENPFGDPIYASILALGNFQYIFVDSKINCIKNSLNYRDNSSPNDDCWITPISSLSTFDLYEQLYLAEHNYLNNYYFPKSDSKTKRI